MIYLSLFNFAPSKIIFLIKICNYVTYFIVDPNDTIHL